MEKAKKKVSLSFSEENMNMDRKKLDYSNLMVMSMKEDSSMGFFRAREN